MSSLRGERLANQLLTGPASSPAAVVSAMVAVQAQEYGWAKWALALRSRAGAAENHATSDAAIEAAVASGAILRTHPMRGTHHFVAPADIRWLLALIRPRSRAEFFGTVQRAAAGVASRSQGGAVLMPPTRLRPDATAGRPEAGPSRTHNP